MREAVAELPSYLKCKSGGKNGEVFIGRKLEEAVRQMGTRDWSSAKLFPPNPQNWRLESIDYRRL
jgi:hypothetical protein